MPVDELISNSGKEHNLLVRRFRLKFWVLDIFTIVFSYILAYFIRSRIFGGLVYSNDYILLLLLTIPTFFILIRRNSFTHLVEKVSFGFIFFNFLQLCIFGLLLMFFFLFILKLKDISRMFVVIFFMVYIISLSILQIYRSQNFRNLFKDYNQSN
jgi:hypothetical protein